MSDSTGLRELAADARHFNTALQQRMCSGDIDTSTDVVVVAFDKRELLNLSLLLLQLSTSADELALTIDQGPTREELLDAATAAMTAADQAREASERLERIMGRLWLKPANDGPAIYHQPESAA